MTDSDPEVQFNTLKSCDDTRGVAPDVGSENEAENVAYYTLPSASDSDEEDEVQNVQGHIQRCDNPPSQNNNVNISSGGHGDNLEDEPLGTNKRPRRRVNFGQENDENIYDDDIENQGVNIRRNRRRHTRKPEINEEFSDSDDNENDERQRKQNRVQRHGRRVQKENINRSYESDIENFHNHLSNKIRNKSNLPTIKPAIYDGTEDWESYFSHFLNCADLGKWSDEEKALTLASCLKGSARTFYLGLRTHEQKVYAVLEQKLSERFGSSRQQTRYLTKFETRKRNVGEAVASYGDDLRLLARRAYPDLGIKAQESLALHQLYKNVSLDLKYKCMDRGCSTIEEVVEIIERCEAILGSDDRKRPAVRNIASKATSCLASNDCKDSIETEIKSQMHNILTRLDKIEANFGKVGSAGKDDRRTGGKYGRNIGECFSCGEMGHFVKDCPRRGQKSGNFKPLV